MNAVFARRASRLVLRLAQTLGILMLIVTFSPLTSVWGRLLAGRSDQSGGGALVVLAGAEATRGFLGVDTYWRCIYAVRAWNTGRFDRIYIAGGPVHEKPVSTEMKELLVFHGVPVDRIFEETRSQSTRENALFLKPLLLADPRPKVLLTSDLHTFRAKRVLERVGIHTTCLPVPDAIKRSGEWQQRWTVFVDLLMETVRTAYYLARGWM